MSLTVLYRSKKGRFVYNLSKQQLGIILLGICGLLLLSSRSTQSPSEDISRIIYAKSGLEQQSQEIESLKLITGQRLTGMLLNLAAMQSQIRGLDALGARLLAEANLNPEEFSFNPAPVKGEPTISSEVGVPSSDALLSKMDEMLDQLQDKTQQLNALESIMLNHHINEQSRLAGRPIESGWLSSYYGIRKDPFSGLPSMHKGLDFAGKEDDPVASTGAGLVVWSGERYGYGNLVEIDHGDGLVTRYGHNKQLNVRIGDVVTKGQHIALMGSTGRSTGPHVHYEVLRKGKQQDPLPFVYRD
ncbi:MAG: murein DD-endopeptidase MepM/ murein hydrolase activator NlpD [Paraglaciecola sp.]|jgi:murein DD-endopeptidase MepM/ murein hydrolase activator NlpD